MMVKSDSLGESKKQQSHAENEATTKVINLDPVIFRPGEAFQPDQMIVGTAYHTGLQRDHNEDTLIALSSMLAENGSDIPFGIFIVADGMGGQTKGEVASKVAARVMAYHVINRLYLPMLIPHAEYAPAPLQEVMETGITAIQDAVVARAPGSGTTITAVSVLGDYMTIAHVGDSRAYWIDANGQIELITHDQSLVQRLIDLGQITEEEAKIYPQRNVLYCAVGQEEPYQAQILSKKVRRPGYLLICSDGLWGQVSKQDMVSIIREYKHPSSACKTLVKAANDAGGPDNISVIIVQFV